MRAGIVLIWVSGLLIAGCGSDDAGSGESIVAAFYPLSYAAERVAPDADVESLTPPGAEPHDVELSARDVQRVKNADLVLYLGEGFMPALEDAVAEHENAVDLLEGPELREAEDEHGFDPHVWLDPMRYADVARATANALEEPGAADDLVEELEELDREFRNGLATCEQRAFVTSHAAFGYLAEAYDLEQIPLTGVSPEAEPSAQDIEALVEEVEEHGVTTVFFETLVSPDLAETVAREAGADAAVLNPLEGLTEDEIDEGADYFSIMRENLAALRKALGCT